MNELKNASYIALKDYMGVVTEETILIVSDEKIRTIGLALFEAGQQLCKESLYVEMKTREVNGQEPPPQISALMQKVDVVVCATTRSLTHTDARRQSVANGVRVGTMPGITVPIMTRCFSANADEIVHLNNKLLRILDGAKKVHLTSKLGTDAVFSATNMQIISSTGIHKTKGAWGNLPSGEVYFAPVENRSYGKLICDGSIAGIGMVETPITIDIENGMITNISDSSQGRQLDEMLSKVGSVAKAVAEFGIGTNPKAQLIGQILEDEKVKGTVHIAFGNNISMGGTQDVGIHIDCIIKSPSIIIDNKKIMEDGQLLI